jgi:serine/threonine-protein kinase
LNARASRFGGAKVGVHLLLYDVLVTVEPEKNAQQSEEDWEREQEEAERALLNERVGLNVGGRYKIVRTLGAGGMGGVYEAEHELIGKKVALKCLHKEYTRDRDLVERFKREARAATAIGNEHIVDVTDMGDLPDGAPFLVMELLAGTTLSGLMEDIGPMPLRRAVHVARQVCDALGAAHEKGIVHRDLKPENVFLTRRGQDPDFVKVLDFGISKIHSGDRPDRGLTRTGMAIGTPTYMSPEQAQGLRDVDARTDVWALGVILYEMLTSHRPFEADSYPMLLMRIVGSEPDPLTKWRRDVPDDLNRIVMRCLEKPVGTRMQTMRELEAALAPFANAVEGPMELVGPDGNFARSSQTHVRDKRSQRPTSDTPEARAATQMVGSTPPPPNTDSGVRASAIGTATRVHGTGDVPPVARVNGSAAADATPARGGSQQTAEIGALVRKAPERTAEIGSVVRSERDPSTGEVPAAPSASGPPWAAIAVGLLAVIAIGVGYMVLGGGGATPPPSTIAAPPSVVAPPTSLAAVPTPPPTTVVAAVPTEVRVRISVVPQDATIRIDDVEFPNPMDAMQPRQLTPVHISVERDGYRGLERLAIFDSDQNFHFELSRGRGVQHVGVSGDEVPEAPAGGHEHTDTPPPPSTGSGHGGGAFRDQF